MRRTSEFYTSSPGCPSEGVFLHSYKSLYRLSNILNHLKSFEGLPPIVIVMNRVNYLGGGPVVRA